MGEDWKERLKQPPKEYRPIPFWSWNDRLDEAETRRQIAEMERAGMGGYFMHARGGLRTDYLGEDWMRNITAGIEEARTRGMTAWGYDENGWPSGFGDGMVNGLGKEYQQKYLRWEPVHSPRESPETIANLWHEGTLYHFYYECNPYYVDTLDERVARAFLERVHEQYRARLGTDFAGLAGFFTDEPQVSRNGIPWSFVLPGAYRERYGEELAERLPGLFWETAGFRRTRFRFWSLVRDLFAEHFLKVIYDWCGRHGVRLTGHVANEDSPRIQLTSNGACMAAYEFLHIPGMDALTRAPPPSLIPMQLSSVCQQLGKRRVLSESFALSGWNVSFEELRWMAEYQMARGVTLFCPHLAAYSLRGIRKRDYPAALSDQQPWWPEYRRLTDLLSRIGMLLENGEVRTEILVYHPQSSVWLHYDDAQNSGAEELERSLSEVMDALESSQLPYHLADERILERYGSVTEGRLQIGAQRYAVVILPGIENLSGTAERLLRDFAAQGGTLLLTEAPPRWVDGENAARPAEWLSRCTHTEASQLCVAVPGEYRRLRVTSPEGTQGLSAAIRDYPGAALYYLVNSTHVRKCCEIHVPGNSAARLDPDRGELEAVDVRAEPEGLVISQPIEAMGSAVFVVFGEARDFPAGPSAPQRPLELVGREWEVAAAEPNALTLDTCDYWFDGEPAGSRTNIGNVQEEACALERPVEVRLRFPFLVEELPEGELFLALESPEKFTITLNSQPVSPADRGWYRDRSFRKREVGGLLRRGVNHLELRTRFAQSEAAYAAIRAAKRFESEKNKLTYDDELEAVYLVGNFGVSTPGEWNPLPRHAQRYRGEFALCRRPERVGDGSLTGQGFPFFAGRLTLRTTTVLLPDETERRCIRFSRLPGIVTKVWINAREAGSVVWAPYEIDCAGLLRPGENTIEIELVSSLRNLLGPHHCREGERTVVTPGDFFQKSGLWAGGVNREWDPGYCFVEFGLCFAGESSGVKTEN